MIVSINQPAYLPWLGYFERIAKSDLHVVLDHVQFEKNSFTNRNKIATKNGPLWLTIPVSTKGKFNDLAINHLEINQAQAWANKHWNSIKQVYGKTPFFKDHEVFFEQTFSRDWIHLSSINYHITEYLLKAFNIPTPLISSSDMKLESSKSGLVLEICKQTHATQYLSGAMGKDYLEMDSFTEAGVTVHFQDYIHPEYTQRTSKEFTPYMAAIDLLFNHGPDSINILNNSK
ncbi:MAG: WbqC family protein [Akkermansiaceae bacterium]